MFEVQGQEFDYRDLAVKVSAAFHAASLDDPFYRFMYRWHGELVADLESNQVPLGTADVLRLRVFDVVESGCDPWEVLDAEEGDLEMVGRVLLDADGFAPELEEAVAGFDSDLVILNHVRLTREVRGHDVGPLFAVLMLEPLIAGARVVACYPAPLEGDHDEASRSSAIDSLGRTWAKAGFRDFAEGVWILDPAAVEYQQAWEQLLAAVGLATSRD